jgi:hypothetical protein
LGEGEDGEDEEVDTAKDPLGLGGGLELSELVYVLVLEATTHRLVTRFLRRLEGIVSHLIVVFLDGIEIRLIFELVRGELDIRS